jgi:hypothetical protein
MSTIRIAFLHLAPYLRDPQVNRRLIDRTVTTAPTYGATWILTPELCICGDDFSDDLGTDRYRRCGQRNRRQVTLRAGPGEAQALREPLGAYLRPQIHQGRSRLLRRGLGYWHRASTGQRPAAAGRHLLTTMSSAAHILRISWTTTTKKSAPLGPRGVPPMAASACAAEAGRR